MNLPPHLKDELLSLRYRKHREASGLLIVEGRSQIRELADSSWKVRYAVSSKRGRPPEMPPDLPLYYAEPSLIARISELQHSPELLVCAEYAVAAFDSLNPLKPIVFTDRISDPGNLGTMLRTGEWFGITQWLIGPGTVDPYNAKVVRAAMGSLPRLTLVASVLPLEELQALRKSGMRIVASVPDSGGAVMLRQNDCLLFGSEAHGLDKEYIELSDAKYSIGRNGTTESLNVAIAFAIAAYSLPTA